jgi:predicted acylesterase/phospholipase RssA
MIKKMIFIFTLLNSIHTLSAPSKQYQHAMVFNGFGPNTATFIGMYVAASEAGLAPDLVLGACGGSIAASMVYLYQKPQKLKKLVHSQAMHRILLNLKQSEFSKNLLNLRFLVKDILKNHRTKQKRFPNIFQYQLYDFPQSPLEVQKDDLSDLEQEFIKRLSNSIDQPIDQYKKTDLIILSARIDFSPEQVHQKITDFYPNQQFIQETHFINNRLYTYYQKWSPQSFIAQQFPNAYFYPRLDFFQKIKLSDAVRASVPDPFIMYPKQWNGHYYMTGSYQLYPLKLLHSLAKKISIMNKGPMPTYQDLGIQQLFGMSTIDQRKMALRNRQPDYMADFTDFDDWNRQKGRPSFYPRLKDAKIFMGIPSNYEQFRQQSKHLYEYGYQKMKLAIDQT